MTQHASAPSVAAVSQVTMIRASPIGMRSTRVAMPPVSVRTDEK